ncbi:hypothetical protein [Rhodopila sp.]|uniref:hypothetical protein n=1 Tax=Rhodopila sp. TaxID=2480087 RepID=UPI003D0B2E0F
MKKLLLTAAFIGSVASHAMAASPIWYAAHLAGDACVPLSNIGPNFERLYYGAGSMRTPEDFRQLLSATGFIVTPESLPDGVVVLHAVANTGDKAEIALFSNRDYCKEFMSLQDR